MAKRFDIKELVGGDLKPTAAEFKISDIPIEKIQPSKFNKYGMDDIEELAASIEEFGLLHNLVVKSENESGMYEIISGERRYRACYLLLKNGDKKYKYLPCKIEKAAMDEITELKLIHANAMARVLTDAEKIYQAGRIYEILHTLKKRGYSFTGRMRRIAAKILDLSDAQVGRLVKMDRDLADEIKGELKAGNIGITMAYEMSALSKDEQLGVLDKFKQTGQIYIRAHKRRHGLSYDWVKEKQIVKTSLERAGISLYHDDGTVRDPAEFGKDIYRFLGIWN